MNISESQDLQAGLSSSGSAKARKYKQTRVWTWARDTWMGDMVRASRAFAHEFHAWTQCQPLILPSVQQLADSIAALDPGDPGAPDAGAHTEAPIFLLSTGWRVGSTLLQRVLVTDPRLMLWGEPLGEMTLVSRLTEVISNCISARNLSLWRNQADPGSPALATSWIANLYPSSGDFRSALQSLLNQWLAAPAHQRGFARWGFKEVRLGAPEAYFLHWLYPNAKFLIISRHPCDSYRSLSDSKWGSIYYRYPDVPIDSVASFAMHWNQTRLELGPVARGIPCLSYQI